MLGDVLSAISLSPLLRSTNGVTERFWDMFVVDAFIKNPNRNNGNWGLLLDLAAAIARFCEAVDMDAIDALIDDVPEEAYGRIVLPDGVKQAHKTLLRTRVEQGFLPLYRKLR